MIARPFKNLPREVLVRAAAPADLDGCAEIFLAARRAAFDWRDRAAFALEDFAKTTAGESIWVALDGDDAILGFASVLLEPGKSFLHSLFIAPDRWGAGIGTALLEYVLDAVATPLELKVDEPNRRARRFYEAHGFSVIERAAAESGPAWLRMRRR